MIRAALRSIGKRTREFFWLTQMQRASSERSPEQWAALRAYFNAARRRLEAARHLREIGQTAASLILFRQATLLLVSAFCSCRLESSALGSLGPEALLSRFSDALAAEQLRAHRAFDRARPLLVSTELMDVDRLAPEEAENRADELDRATRWLAELVEPRTPRQVRTLRTVRWLVLAGVVIALVAALCVWLFARPNLAVGKPAKASSHDYGTLPAGAVDGRRYGQLGFHSAPERFPWLMIDLGARYRIRKVQAFGREDCCYDQSIPLAFEVSNDGITFRTVRKRTTEFRSVKPWVIRPRHLVARFVRFRTLRPSVLVLSEVEVYGERTRGS